MRAARYYDRGDVRIEDIPEPHPVWRVCRQQHSVAVARGGVIGWRHATSGVGRYGVARR